MNKRELIILLFVLTLATFLRLWGLDLIPPGLYPDEAINGNEAITIPGKVFYPENNGREGLFINLIALSFSAFGVSIWSLRIVSAISGILTCFGLYLLVKELFNKEYIALLSSLFLAVSFWHINFSRIAFRGILVPFILVFSFYFLFRGFRTKKVHNFIISGIFFGLGFYTYISYRFVVLLLLIVLLCWWRDYKKTGNQKKYLSLVACLLLVIAIVALPIGIYFLKNPGDFIGRAGPVSIFAAENPIKEFGKSLILHLGMFNFYGDGNWRHNYSGSPMLFWPIGILFLIGFILSIKNLFLAKKEKGFTFYVLCFMITWFFLMLLPGILTQEGIPHALRTIGVIPVVYIFAALGGYSLYNWLNTKIENKKFFLVACCLFLVTLSFTQFYKYFFCWAKNLEVGNAFSKDYVDIGNYLNSLPLGVQKYVVVNREGVPVPFPDGIPAPAQTIMFIENTKPDQTQSIYLVLNEIEKIIIEVERLIINNKKIVIMPMRYDKDLFNKLKEIFPPGKIQEKDGIWPYTINF